MRLLVLSYRNATDGAESSRWPSTTLGRKWVTVRIVHRSYSEGKQNKKTFLITGTLPAFVAHLCTTAYLSIYILQQAASVMYYLVTFDISLCVLSLASVLFFFFWYFNSKGGHQGDQHRVPYPTGPLAGPPAHRRADVAGGNVSAAGGRDGYGEGGEGVPEDTLQQHQGRPRPEGETRHHRSRRRVARCCSLTPTSVGCLLVRKLRI